MTASEFVEFAFGELAAEVVVGRGGVPRGVPEVGEELAGFEELVVDEFDAFGAQIFGREFSIFVELVKRLNEGKLCVEIFDDGGEDICVEKFGGAEFWHHKIGF